MPLAVQRVLAYKPIIGASGCFAWTLANAEELRRVRGAALGVSARRLTEHESVLAAQDIKHSQLFIAGKTITVNSYVVTNEL